MLSTSELQTLKAVNDRESCEPVSRRHLEKLSRLDLIEPCDEGLCLSSKGQQVLGK